MGAQIQPLSSALRRGGLLALAPPLTVAVFLLPIAAGLLATLMPAFGYLPAIGGHDFGVGPWRALFAHPGVATSVALSAGIGLAATLLSFALAVGAMAALHGRPAARGLKALLAPLLATPHSAMAIGFAFLLAPSGWFVRLVSPGITGWQVPPDVATVGHPAGLAVVAGLLLKEVPYLMLMIAAALQQLPARAQVDAARTLGYAPVTAWVRIVLPQVYPQIRLPVYAVLAFSLSVVDVSLVLGPGNPPPLAVLALRWFSDADVRLQFQASAAACLQAAMVVGAIALWYAGERCARGFALRGAHRGRRRGAWPAAARAAALLACAALCASLLAIVALAVWSFAAQWRFPGALPQAWTLQTWAARAEGLGSLVLTTTLLAAASTLIACALVVACLEAESRLGLRTTMRSTWLLYTPLLVPQIAFLFGTQVALLRLGLDGSWLALVWAHLLFVLPYLFLSLADPWRALDPRYVRSAAALGASPARGLWVVKLPLLLRPLLAACAVGFAVSAGQYLPTLFAGNGRVATLTTEAVALASGADRRLIGAYGFVQAMLPVLVYGLALAVPAWAWRRRKGMAVDG